MSRLVQNPLTVVGTGTNTMNILASNDATFKGATVRADNTLNLNVANNLTVESVRDSSSSASHGMNASMGVSVGGNNSSLSGANASVGMNNSRSSEKQTVLTSLTGDTVNITTGNDTHIKGALVAAGEKDTNGVFQDNNNLNLSTKTLTFENLANTKSSNSTGLGMGAGVNSSGAVSSVSAQIATGTSYERTKTLATLGNGNITITDTANSDEMERLNRDTTNINKSLVKTSTGTRASGTLDTRILTEAGRTKIKDDVQTASTIVDSIVQIATTERAGAFDFFKETEKNVNVLNGIKNAMASDEKLAKQLSNPDLSPEQKQAMLGEVAKTVMVSLGYTPNETKIMYNDTPGEDGVSVRGHYSSETNTNYINDKYNDSTKELVSTTGHETQHAMDQQLINQGKLTITNKADNEQYATNFGNTVADYTDYVLGYNNKETMAQTNSHEGAMTLTTPNKTVNVITSPLLTQNNNEFAGVDKSLGEDAILYRKNGQYVGWDGKKDNDVYITKDETSVEKKNDKTINVPEDSTKLPISNSAFENIAGVIKKEGATSDPNEYIDLAHASKNYADENHKSLESLLLSSYSSVPDKNPLSSSNNSVIDNHARAGVIDALTNSNDPTFGATLWDGSDFLAWGSGKTPYNTLGHAKFRQYNSITINDEIYNGYLDSQPNSLKYGNTRYQIPQNVFTNKSNWTNGSFYYDTGINSKYGLEATTTAGKTIFWKKVK